VTVAPSATVWHTTATRPVAANDTVVVASGPGLTGAADEAAAVAAIHGVSPLTGAVATVEAVLYAMGSAGLLHLAAHGRLSADNPLFSALLLADGPLVVYDLEGISSVPPTVVLAACDSGRTLVYAGDELLGLTSTLIGGGATQLIASVLPIPDAETAPLMVALHRRLAAGDAPAMALAAAQAEVDPGDAPALAAAAGFVCMGAGFRSVGSNRS
jgi:CHAT domain-containing protein